MNPGGQLLGGLVSGLIGGIPDMVAAIKEKRAAKKAEKLQAAGFKQIAGGALLGGIVENPEAIINGVSLLNDGASLNIPPEILDAPDWLRLVYIGLLAAGVISRMVASAYAQKAKQEQLNGN